jgi:hypothetical protein
MTRAREYVGRFGRQDLNGTVDENGFHHFEGPQRTEPDIPETRRFRNGFGRVSPDVSTWWSDLARQVGKDLGVVVVEE